MKVKAKQKNGKLIIKIKEKNKGKLHEDLNVPEDEKISEKKMEAAKGSASPVEKKRIVFAENAKKWNKGQQN